MEFTVTEGTRGRRFRSEEAPQQHGQSCHTQKVRVSTPSMNRWIKNKSNQKHLLHYINPNNRKASDTFPIYAKNSSFFFDKMSFSNKSYSVCRRITFCPTCTSRFLFKTLQTDDVNLLAIEWNLRKNQRGLDRYFLLSGWPIWNKISTSFLLVFYETNTVPNNHLPVLPLKTGLICNINYQLHK